MRNVTTIVVGAGHAGLAMSRCLDERAIDHVVLERGEVANSWKTERWDSLRLLTPNWQNHLPGQSYAGDDPDGFAGMPEVVSFLDRYAERIAAPVRTHTQVTSVTRTATGYQVQTDRGDWHARSVVLASGACNVPTVPRQAETIAPAIRTLTTQNYRNPGQLEEGGVLVIGASATGVQLADEIHRSGRPVTLAVGEHVRAPRTYRGRDIHWWMEATGLHDQRYDQVDDLARVRRLPSFQLVGSNARAMLDLNALGDVGVRLVGRLAAIDGTRLQFSGALGNQCALADLKMGRLLDTIDLWVRETGREEEFEAPHRFAPTRVDASPTLGLDLRREGIRTIVWATGYRPDFSWLEVPVFDRKGRIRHDGGVVDSPGLYLMGMPFLRRRKSGLITGAADDARDLADHLAAYLGVARQPKAA